MRTAEQIADAIIQRRDIDGERLPSSEVRSVMIEAAQRGMKKHDWTRDQVLAIAADYEADGSLAERSVERWATEVTRQLHAGGFVNTVEGDE